MKAKRRNGRWSYRRGKASVHFFDPDNEASRRLAQAGATFGTPPFDDDLFEPAMEGDLLCVRGSTSGTRYPICDATKDLWLLTREEAVRTETQFLVQQHRDHQASKPKPSSILSAKGQEAIQQAEQGVSE